MKECVSQEVGHFFIAQEHWRLFLKELEIIVMIMMIIMIILRLLIIIIIVNSLTSVESYHVC